MRVCVYNKNKNRKRSWEELENISNKILTIENMINLENIMNTEMEKTVMNYQKKMQTFVTGYCKDVMYPQSKSVMIH